MGSLKNRLDRLEDGNASAPSEEEQKQHWLAVGRASRVIENENFDEFYAYDVFKALRRHGKLDGVTTAEEFRSRVLAWPPPPKERAVERVVARTIYGREQGTENMVCPPEWRESFEAADELRKRSAAVPVEVRARLAVMQYELEQGGSDEIARQVLAEVERLGFTDDLLLKVVGPDAEEIAEEERMRRLREVFAEDLYGERGYLIAKRADQLMKERTEDGKA